MIFSAILPRRLFTTHLLQWFFADWLSAAVSWGNGSQSSCIQLSRQCCRIASFKDYCFNPLVCCGTCVNPLYVNPSIYTSFPVEGKFANLLQTCRVANKSVTSWQQPTSRCNGIWETTPHNRHNRLLPAPTCYGFSIRRRGNWC